MPGFARDYVDPKDAFEKRAQEYEVLLQAANEKRVLAERGHSVGLSAVREAQALVTSIVRDEEKDAETWKSNSLKTASRLLSFLSAAIQSLEQSQ